MRITVSSISASAVIGDDDLGYKIEADSWLPEVIKSTQVAEGLRADCVSGFDSGNVRTSLPFRVIRDLGTYPSAVAWIRDHLKAGGLPLSGNICMSQFFTGDTASAFIASGQIDSVRVTRIMGGVVWVDYRITGGRMASAL